MIEFSPAEVYKRPQAAIPLLVVESRNLELEICGKWAAFLRLSGCRGPSRILDTLRSNPDGYCWSRYEGGEDQSIKRITDFLVEAGFNSGELDWLVSASDWTVEADKMGLDRLKSTKRVLAGLYQWPGCDPEIGIELEGRSSTLAIAKLRLLDENPEGNILWEFDSAGRAWFNGYLDDQNYYRAGEFGLRRTRTVLEAMGFGPGLADVAFKNMRNLVILP